jgi:hypothetical protein
VALSCFTCIACGVIHREGLLGGSCWAVCSG